MPGERAHERVRSRLGRRSEVNPLRGLRLEERRVMKHGGVVRYVVHLGTTQTEQHGFRSHAVRAPRENNSEVVEHGLVVVEAQHYASRRRNAELAETELE